MALKYHLVERRDLSKNAEEGDKLVYGQVRAGEPVTLEELCEQIADESTASAADVLCVLKGMVDVMKKGLPKGRVYQVTGLGNFRMNAGSKGVKNEEDFHTSLFKKGRIVFVPDVKLRALTTNLKFEKLTVVMEKCDKVHAA